MSGATLRRYASVGITRLSIGAQAMSAAALRRLGRRHRVVDVVRTVAEARAAGIASISLDLLYDAPDATLVDWIDTLDAALALEPDHLSLYALTLDDPDAEGLTGPDGDHLPTTAGARRWRANARPVQDEDRAAAQYHHAVHRLAADGWRGYEISNWARPGTREPAQPRLLGAAAIRGGRPGSARLRRRDATLERRTSRRIHRRSSSRSEVEHRAFPRAVRRRSIRRLRPPSGSSSGSEPTAACRSAAARTPPLEDAFGWALAAELLDVTPDDRVVLTTRGRLLSNELFGRLV